MGLTRFALLALTADRAGHGMPPIPQARTPRLNHEVVAGRYRCGDHSLAVCPGETGTEVTVDGEHAGSEARGGSTLFVDHPLTRAFLVQAHGPAGAPAHELRHGFSVWTREGLEPSFVPPSPLVGSYEAFNPWLSNLHVVMRPEGLILIRGRGVEEALCPTDDPLTFRIGADDCPDYLRFKPPVLFRRDHHQALGVDLCGAEYHLVA